MTAIATILATAAPIAANFTEILGEAEAVEAIVIQLEPSAKTLLLAEWSKVKTSVATILSAAASFQSASLFGKATQAFALLSSLLDIGTVLEGIYADGESYFAAQWPAVKAHLDAILGMVMGKTTGTSPTAVILPATA